MKALFLIFHGFDKANGISKKIHYQVKALKECGVDARLCYYDITPHCERRLMIDNEVIADFGTGTTAKVWKRIYYAPIIKYARREKIEFVYIQHIFIGIIISTGKNIRLAFNCLVSSHWCIRFLTIMQSSRNAMQTKCTVISYLSINHQTNKLAIQSCISHR